MAIVPVTYRGQNPEEAVAEAVCRNRLAPAAPALWVWSAPPPGSARRRRPRLRRQRRPRRLQAPSPPPPPPYRCSCRSGKTSDPEDLQRGNHFTGKQTETEAFLFCRRKEGVLPRCSSRPIDWPTLSALVEVFDSRSSNYQIFGSRELSLTAVPTLS